MPNSKNFLRSSTKYKYGDQTAKKNHMALSFKVNFEKQLIKCRGEGGQVATPVNARQRNGAVEMCGKKILNENASQHKTKSKFVEPSKLSLCPTFNGDINFMCRTNKISYAPVT